MGMTGMIEVIQTYWVYFLIGQFPDGPLGGLSLTIVLAAGGLLLAFPLGVALAIARMSPWRMLSWPVSGVVYVVRGTPLLMVLFWAYFFLPSITGQKISQFSTMLGALVLFNAAYLSEIFRAGIQALPTGQFEAARSLGLSYFAALRLVVMPQVMRNMLPSLVNQFVSTIKDTSLGYIIGLSEVSFIASQINNLVLTKPTEIYLVLALAYFILCFGLSRFAFWLECRHMQRSHPSQIRQPAQSTLMEQS
jgi:polar amino acid transport system permease protein